MPARLSACAVAGPIAATRACAGAAMRVAAKATAFALV